MAWWTLAFHTPQPAGPGARVSGSPPIWQSSLPLTLTIMVWVTWASSSLAGSLHAAGEELERLNAELAQARDELERRVEERTDALRASQARVIQQEKMAAFGLLAAGIAHEVGNPLAALSSLVQILKRKRARSRTPPKSSTWPRASCSGSRRTIRELIDFSRPASTVVTTIRIAEVVDEALGHRQVLSAHQAALDHDRYPGRSAAGPGRARLPDAGRAEPGLERDRRDRRPGPNSRGRVDRARWLVLTVEDDGRGISMADRCRLFQPFFTTKAHGTGLGLFVSRQILEDFAGTLSFRSEPGQGSTFIVRLPLERIGRSPADGELGGGDASRMVEPAAISRRARRRPSRRRPGPLPSAWETRSMTLGATAGSGKTTPRLASRRAHAAAS